MRLRRQQRNWDDLAAQDPLRAILGRPGQGSEWDEEAFFATGVDEISRVMEYVGSLNLPARRSRALDFGCGVGRLSQPLAEYFEHVVGVDIAPAMIELAKGYNRRGRRCEFVANRSRDLSSFDDRAFDFIYSNITLQHIPTEAAKNYLAEFVRLLAPGGLILFHLPSRRLSPLVARILPLPLYSACSRTAWRMLHPGQPWIEMHGIPRRKVVSWMERSGGRVLDVQPQDTAGSQWETFRYAVTR